MSAGFYWEMSLPDYDRKALRWDEWGSADRDFLAPALLPAIVAFVGGEVGMSGLRRTPAKRLEELDVPESRLLRRLSELEKLCGKGNATVDLHERVLHSAGRSYYDVLRLRRGELPDYVDAVCYPSGEAQLTKVLAWAAENKVALIPYGGGSSVVGGLEVVRGSSRGVISVDLTRMNKLLNLNPADRTALFEAGIYGPQAEHALNPGGWTLGHFPQSFEYSTLGGWVAARSAGQQSNRYGKIEEILNSVRMITPAGVVETNPVPAGATGPDWNQIIAGSEGLLGMISQVRVKVHELPEERRYFGLLFPSFAAATAFLRDCVRKEIPSAMIRLSDEDETRLLQVYARIGRGKGLLARWKTALDRLALRAFGMGERPCVALVGLEGDRRSNRRNEGLVRALMRSHGGMYAGRKLGRNWMRGRFNMPFLRRHFMENGVGVDTFETAVPYSRVADLHKHLLSVCREALPGCLPMCHISHNYHDGVCMYFTVIFEMDVKKPLEQWVRFKKAVSDALLESGGNISHHHGVGFDHKTWYRKSIGPVASSALQGLKANLDPNHILNAGKLFDE